MNEDTPNPELSFINPHYATAAATMLGGYGGGYHYPGKDYSGRFLHPSRWRPARRATIRSLTVARRPA